MLQAEQIGPTILHLSFFALMDESNLSAKTAKVHIKVNIILFCVTNIAIKVLGCPGILLKFKPTDVSWGGGYLMAITKIF